MASQMRKFAVVTGASTGIGYELAKICLKNEFDILIAADEPEIEHAAATLRQGSFGAVEAVEADLSGPEMKGQGDVVTGWHNKLQSAIASITPADLLAELHRGMAQPER